MKLSRTFTRWGLVSVDGDGPYLAGMEETIHTRATTRLVEFDPAAGTALTVNGRPYVLAGREDPGYGVGVFTSLWNTVGQEVRSLTHGEALEMIARQRDEDDCPGVAP